MCLSRVGTLPEVAEDHDLEDKEEKETNRQYLGQRLMTWRWRRIMIWRREPTCRDDAVASNPAIR